MNINELVKAIAQNDGSWGNIQYGDQWSLNRAKGKAEKLLALVDGDITKALAIVEIF